MFEKLKELFGIRQKSEEHSDSGDIVSSAAALKDPDDISSNLKISLIQADVVLPVADEISDTLYKKIKEGRIKLRGNRDAVLREAIRDTITEVASVPSVNLIDLSEKKSPFVILFVGMNGTGKTTTIAKLGDMFKSMGKYVVIAASDTFRAGAIEQIAIHGDKIGVKVIKHQAKGDPAAVAFDAVKHASKFQNSVVLIDTAGRMQTNKNLLEEMKKIKRTSLPDFTILTIDALAGADVLNQARLFDEAVGIDGYIVTKIDSDAKGGSIISLLAETKKPILFIGTGQAYTDLVPFTIDWYLNKLLT
ncbi:MAG: signal recognition particle-docking protein FtsY [Thermoplasmatales archaeon]